jgi:hypothetical protein
LKKQRKQHEELAKFKGFISDSIGLDYPTKPPPTE